MHEVLRPLLLVVVGPTAVGKTEISIQLAKRLDAEIVSSDSRLFYRGMDIGTAKPTPTDRAAVPHHLIDIADPDQPLSLAIFQRLAHEVISEVRSRGHLPMLVGGTGQYIRAVTAGWNPPLVKPNVMLRGALQRLSDDRGSHWLHGGLRRMDPEAARSIDPRNSRRTIRALEVILTTGCRFSAQRGHGLPVFLPFTLGLFLPRPVLYERIDARIDCMFEAGLLEETRRLLSRGYSPSLPALSAIGYRECVQVIEGNLDIEQAKAAMRRATRAFVRRQSNWFKQSDTNIHWFEAGSPNVVAAMEASVRRELAA
jgi:tRNA dimethylallyltransferase